MAVILLTEDDDAVRQITRMHLELAGHTVLEAGNAAEARCLTAGTRPALALTDIMMPGEDGFSLGEYLIGLEIPVIFLTAKTAVTDRVRGLRLGAEDYVLKPFEPAELLARIENVLRRNEKPETAWEDKHLRVDFDARSVRKDGEEIPMTAMEFDLLARLVRERGAAISREALLRAVWGWQYMGETRTVDVHVQRLRCKIGAEYIETVFKYGYRFRGDL